MVDRIEALNSDPPNARRRPSRKLLNVVIGVGLGITAHQLEIIDLIRDRQDEKVVALSDVKEPTNLTSEQREALYGPQVMFYCQIGGENPRLVDVIVGGPETPIEFALQLDPDPAYAWALLGAGVENYNQVAPDAFIQTSRDVEAGVLALNGRELSATELWGVKSMTLDVFQDAYAGLMVTRD